MRKLEWFHGARTAGHARPRGARSNAALAMAVSCWCPWRMRCGVFALTGMPRRGARAALLATALLAVCALFVPPAAAAGMAGFDPALLAHMQGTYRFDDGTCVTGGRMDEDGVRLLYMDVWQNRTGLLFDARPDGLAGLVPPGAKLRFDDAGDTMTLALADGSSRVAYRLHRPDARAVEFTHADVPFAGTLYRPAGARGNLPAVVLAHGSGATDRFAGPWITFFTDLGFAVLAYDKRGVGQSGGDWRTATYADLAGDLGAAVDWLARQPGIDPARIGIHSSSQSGWYAPLAARAHPRVRFLIQRAGPGLWIGPVTQHENIGDWRADGVPESDIASAAAAWLRLNQLARHGGTRAQAQQLIDDISGERWFAATFGDAWRHVDAEAWRRRQANARLDPAATAAGLGIPVLWFLADQDENVPYAQSRAAIVAARKRRRADLTLVSAAGAKHSFLVEDADGAVHFTDRYWPRMARWLRVRGFTRRDFDACKAD